METKNSKNTVTKNAIVKTKGLKREKKKENFKIVVLVLAILIVITVGIYLSWGTYKISPLDIIKTLLGEGTKMQNTAIMSIRLPRMFVGISVGIALATAGALLQTITKNDLADPSIIGINSGAAVLMHFLSGRNRIRPRRLLLIGIGMNAGLNAFITFFTFRGGVGDYNRVLFWTSGSLWGAGWSYAKIIIPLVAIIFTTVYVNYKKLDVLNLSDEHGVSLGLNLNKERKKFLACAVILAGGATAFAGNVGFVGLICPHIARKLVGPYHKSFLLVR